MMLTSGYNSKKLPHGFKGYPEMNWIFGYFGVACKSVYFIKIFMFLKLNFWILRIFGFWDFIDFLDFSLELLFQSRYHESCQNQGILDFFKIPTISLFASNSRIFGFFQFFFNMIILGQRPLVSRSHAMPEWFRYWLLTN